MKVFSLFILTVIGSLSSLSQPVAVVELFTSQGCSSCPPADQLLSEIVDDTYMGVEVIGLSFHVDYWDYLGWKDPFASEEFTERQSKYASKLKSRQVYTPQMILNGKLQFVGSRRSSLNENLNKVKPQSLKKLQIQITENSNSTIKLSFNPPGTGNAYQIAIVEKDLSRNVSDGENKGKTLTHDNVVRSFKTVKEGSETSISIPEDCDLSKISLVVFEQNLNSYEILSAISTPL